MQKDHTHRSSAKAGKPGALYEKFIYPPFTVLDARSGWWAQRKSDWLARGLDSGDGRSNELLFATSSHPLTQAAQAAGARVVGVPHGYLNVVQARARAYANASGAMLLPFGLDCPEAAHAIAQVARALPVCPGEVWCAAGSGTLTRALQAAWPNARHVAVLVGKKDPPTGRAERIAVEQRLDDTVAELLSARDYQPILRTLRLLFGEENRESLAAFLPKVPTPTWLRLYKSALSNEFLSQPQCAPSLVLLREYLTNAGLLCTNGRTIHP